MGKRGGTSGKEGQLEKLEEGAGESKGCQYTYNIVDNIPVWETAQRRFYLHGHLGTHSYILSYQLKEQSIPQVSAYVGGRSACLL